MSGMEPGTITKTVTYSFVCVHCYFKTVYEIDDLAEVLYRADKLGWVWDKVNCWICPTCSGKLSQSIASTETKGEGV